MHNPIKKIHDTDRTCQGILLDEQIFISHLIGAGCHALDEDMNKLVEAFKKECSLSITASDFDLRYLRISGRRPEFFVRLGTASFFAKTEAGLVSVDSKIKSASWLSRLFEKKRDLASCDWTEVSPLELGKMLPTAAALQGEDER
jgi:hypothetical protein